MRNAVPIEHLLLFLSSDTIILVEEIKERTLGLLQRRICAGLEISQVGEDAFFEFLGILYWSTKGLKAEREASDDICAGNVEEVVPWRSSA